MAPMVRDTATDMEASISADLPYGVARVPQDKRHVEEHAQVRDHQHPSVLASLNGQAVRYRPLGHVRHLHQVKGGNRGIGRDRVNRVGLQH